MVRWHHRLDGHEFEQALGVGDGQRSLACCSPRERKESDTTERLNNRQYENAPTDAGEDARRTLRLMDPSIIAARLPLDLDPQLLQAPLQLFPVVPPSPKTNLLWPKRLTSKVGLGTSRRAPCLLHDSW